MIYIYLVENCYGNSNSVYIGKCTHPGQRKCQHIKKFGSESTFTIIDEVESNWKPLESYWIHQFKQWGFNMVNKNDGGGGPSSRPPEFIERLRNNRLGTKHSDDTKMKMSASNSKPKPDGFGDKLKKPNTNPWSGRPVYQCDLDGNIIQLWSSGKEASQTLSINRGSISSVLAGKYQTAGGFKWKYAIRDFE
jgi:hypothetical protein